MAKVTVTFEDIEEGVSVKVESEPAFPGPDAPQELQDSLTQAQQMGLRMTQLLTEEVAAQNGHTDHLDPDHVHDEHEAPKELSEKQVCPYQGNKNEI